MKQLYLTLSVGLAMIPTAAMSQSTLFDFNNGPRYASVPLDQVSGNIRAHFTATGQGFSIQYTPEVIGMMPAGFDGFGLTPNSVFPSDLMVSFFDFSTGNPLFLSDASIMVAPQELACDSSSTMKISAYSGTTFVGSNTAITADQNYTWPLINLDFSSTTPFDNIVIHFQSGPPTGGDWGPIFAADNLLVTPSPVPEPASIIGLAIGALALCQRFRRKE
ncbi:MAG: PEP-CTERM sorting domain-containing protein [Armatimonadetes bacterium]|nr:PEP-CTERM sorting domain-containing protein [Armatimonadota bacterium]